MEAVVEGSNMRKAHERVVANKGAAGVDRMSVGELGPYLRAHWARMNLSSVVNRPIQVDSMGPPSLPDMRLAR